jgi:Glyoxalase-like domain
VSESTSVPRMSIRSFTIDSADPYRIAQWWCQAFGVPPSPEDFPDDPAALCELPDGPRLLFERVPEPKVVKNRAHIDILAGLRRDEEVERLIGLGASLFADHREPDGSGFVVLADPDGNEFCVERGERDL